MRFLDLEVMMSTRTQIGRRGFLRLAAGSALALGAGGLSSVLGGCATEAPDTSTERGVSVQGMSDADIVRIALEAVPSEVNLWPGQATRVWTYRGEVLEGDPNAVQHLPGSYLGPILRLQRGQRVQIEFTNRLPESSIVHWHGLHVPEAADGHPRLAIDPGERYGYEFQMINRAGTYWYHPHPHGRTGPQVYHGLAGLMVVSDENEAALGLPGGERDVPLVIQDRTFDADNQLIYLGNGMMDRVMGYLGDQILVNGQPDFVLPAATGAYRLRILNGSNSRTYKLAWHDGTPLTVIATDGGLLERAVSRDYVMLSPGERVELWIDFGGRQVGTELRLQSLPFAGGEAGGMGMMGRGQGMMGGRSALPDGTEFTVMRVSFMDEVNETKVLPERLSTPQFHQVGDAGNRRRPRTFEIAMRRMQWLINGRSYEMEGVARDEIVKLGDLEVWAFDNQQVGMQMIHPMHIHNVQFQVIDRQVLPQFVDAWQTVSGGLVDEGWKDTVLVMPGERVELLVKFEHNGGLYLYHCHNLEHEDMGFMRNYRIKA